MARSSKQNPVPRLGESLVALCKGLVRDLFDTYRPERHYMRGPGPKHRAKLAA